MASFEQRRRDRLEALKVSKEEVIKSMWEPQKRAPEGKGAVPTLDLVMTKDAGPVPFGQLLADMLDAKGNVEKLQQCQEKYNLPESKANTHATVDWKEVDHYDDFVVSLRELGYVSQLPSSAESRTKYRPAHLDGFSDATAEKAMQFQKEWDSRGFAFLPHLASISMHVYMQQPGFQQKYPLNTGLGKRILEAAAKSKDPSLAQKITDAKKGGLSSHLMRAKGRWYQQLPPGTSQILLQEAGVKDPQRLDDMGVAIFWKDRRLVATEISTHTYPDALPFLWYVVNRINSFLIKVQSNVKEEGDESEGEGGGKGFVK
ncbi:hypothetical protein AK812_SmicGene33405, partial [Symbiodinium microadriaticum]